MENDYSTTTPFSLLVSCIPLLLWPGAWVRVAICLHEPIESGLWVQPSRCASLRPERLFRRWIRGLSQDNQSSSLEFYFTFFLSRIMREYSPRMLIKYRCSLHGSNDSLAKNTHKGFPPTPGLCHLQHLQHLGISYSSFLLCNIPTSQKMC